MNTLNAPTLATVSLVISAVVLALLTTGVVLARMKRYDAHKWVQTTAVLLNFGLVLAVMVGSFAKTVAPKLPGGLGDAYYGVAAAHGISGLIALVYGMFVMLRGHKLVPKRLRFKRYKPFMRVAYALYVVATLLGVAVYATWYSGDAPPQAAVAQAGAGEILVPMADFTFAPREIVVPQGATVVWVNQDAARHNVVADDGAAFRSELLASGQSFNVEFAQLGTFPYFCELHGGAGGIDMAGVVRVVPADQAPAIAAAPAPVAQPTAANALDAAPELPSQARTSIAALLDDGPGLPARQGYVAGLKAQADELQRHAELAARAQQTGDVAGMHLHAEHVYNLLAGSLDPQFGDLNGDGRAQNPGDGFGMLPNGAQAGYIGASLEAASAASSATDSTDAIKLHAGHVQVTVENVQGWAAEARAVVLRISAAPDAANAAGDTAQLVTLSQQIARGADANGDGEIAPVAGEGGALVALEHARYMAGLDLGR